MINQTNPETLPFYGVVSENLTDVETALSLNSNILYGVHVIDIGEINRRGIVRGYSIHTRGERFEFVDERQKPRNIIYAILAKYISIRVKVVPNSSVEFLSIKTDRITPWELGELLDTHIYEWKKSQEEGRK